MSWGEIKQYPWTHSVVKAWDRGGGWRRSMRGKGDICNPFNTKDKFLKRNEQKWN